MMVALTWAAATCCLGALGLFDNDDLSLTVSDSVCHRACTAKEMLARIEGVFAGLEDAIEEHAYKQLMMDSGLIDTTPNSTCISFCEKLISWVRRIDGMLQLEINASYLKCLEESNVATPATHVSEDDAMTRFPEDKRHEEQTTKATVGPQEESRAMAKMLLATFGIFPKEGPYIKASAPLETTALPPSITFTGFDDSETQTLVKDIFDFHNLWHVAWSNHLFYVASGITRSRFENAIGSLVGSPFAAGAVAFRLWLKDRSDNDDELAYRRVARIFYDVAARMQNINYIRHPDHQDSAGNALCQNSEGAFTLAEIAPDNVYACPHFFKLEPSMRIIALMHEATHLAPSRTADICAEFEDEDEDEDRSPTTTDVRAGYGSIEAGAEGVLPGDIVESLDTESFKGLPPSNDEAEPVQPCRELWSHQSKASPLTYLSCKLRRTCKATVYGKQAIQEMAKSPAWYLSVSNADSVAHYAFALAAVKDSG